MTIAESTLVEKGFIKHANGSWSKRGADTGSPAQGPIPQPAVRDEQVGAAKGKAAYPGRVAVHVTSHRSRLCDPDNLCAKYFIDGLRYAGILHDDRPEDIALQVDQKKVPKKEERTVITVAPIGMGAL